LKSRKIFILLPDGVGLRNFAFTSFAELGTKKGWDITFWNHTPFQLSELGLKEIKLNGKPRPLTDIFKRAKIESELNHFEKKFEDKVYSSYKFPSSNTGWKNKLKNSIVRFLTNHYSGERGIMNLRNKIEISERKGDYYRHCIEVLKREKPDMIFCTNQRALNAVAPITAAKDLGISTSCFIFSWDNLPKATKIVETDYYMVWSDYMKNEIQSYYPYISETQIKITGSPQFEPHFDMELRVSKEDFFKEYSLEPNRDYLCYSGDDITTAPHDELYLRDIAEAVRKLNADGENIGIIFRRSPVDISGRYKEIIENFSDVIVPIVPEWIQLGEEWNTVLPSKSDLKLQTNIIQHTFMVINVGSSMVFDYSSYRLPCAYINYNPDVVPLQKDIKSVYNYIHFRSMPNENAVLWINEKMEISEVIKKVVQGESSVEIQAKKWFDLINRAPHDKSSERIWNAFNEIVQ